jgi:alpha-tubulin suppressor-like RCC1 family protein
MSAVSRKKSSKVQSPLKYFAPSAQQQFNTLNNEVIRDCKKGQYENANSSSKREVSPRIRNLDVTTEGEFYTEVFSWGSDSHGQLGLGESMETINTG